MDLMQDRHQAAWYDSRVASQRSLATGYEDGPMGESGCESCLNACVDMPSCWGRAPPTGFDAVDAIKARARPALLTKFTVSTRFDLPSLL